jgi:polyisoprenoid-binding protein YceI
MCATNAATSMPEEATIRYLSEAKESIFTVQAFSTGLLAAFGHNPKIAIRDFQGEAQLAPGDTFEGARLNFRIRASSLEVVDDISKNDRDEINRMMYDQVLDVDRFPEMVYECDKVSASGSKDLYWAALRGNLTLRGITHSVPVSARVFLNNDSLRASGEFTVRQKDFDIPAVTVAAGTIRLKDELKCVFDIAWRKQE